MKLHLGIDDALDADMALAKQLVSLAERHHLEPDVYHTSLARARRCTAHVDLMRPFVERYGAHTVDVEDATAPGVIDTLRQAAGAMAGRSPEAGHVLLKGLRDTYPLAHRAEIAWIILQQGAKAARDSELLAALQPCVEEAEQTWKWLRSRIKEGSAQVLAIKK